MTLAATDPFADNYILTEKEKEEIRCSAASNSSEATLVDNPNFISGSSLFINAHGIGVIRFPLPSSELEIPIYYADGTLAYTSTREKRNSGNAVLSHPKFGKLVSTSYFFGPNRDPVIELLNAPGTLEASKIKVTGKWTSRSAGFVMPNGMAFEWSYGKVKNAEGKRVNLIVLRQKDNADSKAGRGKVIAQLIRSEETRTPGSTSCSAGNGGKLVLAQDACAVLDESVIVATCLLMLKKEIDRRRCIQMAMIGAVASGGA